MVELVLFAGLWNFMLLVFAILASWIAYISRLFILLWYWMLTVLGIRYYRNLGIWLPIIISQNPIIVGHQYYRGVYPIRASGYI